MSRRPFAVFDIDGTLVRWQLYHAVVHKLGKMGQLRPGDFEAINKARAEWKNRRSEEGFHDYEQVLVERFLAALPGINVSAYQTACQEVYDEYKDQTFTYTRDLAKRLKEKGYLLFAVSGSPQELVERLAAHHGFDAAVGCTFETKDSQFTGDFTTPIFDKKAALDRLIGGSQSTYADSYAVGDSASDAAMLAAVANPIAFCPDRQLYQLAQANHWKVVVERKNVIYEL